uniref:Uncharacterized protein n=1 Tax=Anguilla anguilla TaxID=7936 RepID=A0A0E9WKV1_ANGAN
MEYFFLKSLDIFSKRRKHEMKKNLHFIHQKRTTCTAQNLVPLPIHNASFFRKAELISTGHRGPALTNHTMTPSRDQSHNDPPMTNHTMTPPRPITQ